MGEPSSHTSRDSSRLQRMIYGLQQERVERQREGEANEDQSC